MQESLVQEKKNPQVLFFFYKQYIELFDISQTEKKEFPFIKLKEEQKNGIATVHGNPTKVKRECPFRVFIYSF